MWKTVELANKSQILAYLETDRLYAAYAIGDLEAGLFAQCTWVGTEKDGQLGALALCFRGLEPPALFLMGMADGLRAILGGALRPDRAYITCQPNLLAMTREFYAWDETSPMIRMALQATRFQPGERTGECIRLTTAHSEQLTWLYAQAETVAFSPVQVEHGVFYGVLQGRELVAAAGTHLVSPTYGVAAVGNVFTHSDHRRQGHGTTVTGAVVAELLRLGIRDIVLNVGQRNVAAIRVYERLGFERYCPFLEGPASTRRAL